MEKLLPQLRFPEFRGEWEDKIFDEISEITRLAGYEYSKYWKEDSEGDIIALRGYNIGKGKVDLIKLSYISDELSMQLKRSRLYKGDIVYPCVGSIGNAVVIEESDKFHIQQNLAKISCKTMASPYYIVQFLMSDFGMNEVHRFNASGAQPNVLVGSLRNYKINLPSLPEQTKIATFLTVVDEKLIALKQKKTLLEQYKKGVMQQIFAQELRFKDDNGNDFADWEEKKLGEVCVMTSSKRVYLNDYVSEGIPFYRGKEISELRLNKLPSDLLFISKERYDDFKSKYGIPLKNDILITAVGTLGNVLRIRNDDPFYFKDGNLIWLKNITENACFLEIILEWENSELIKTSIGSTQKALTMIELRKLTFNFPSLPEQTKIANFLSAIDEKINQCQDQIEKAGIWKKGLLQQLFV